MRLTGDNYTDLRRLNCEVEKLAAGGVEGPAGPEGPEGPQGPPGEDASPTEPSFSNEEFTL